MFSILPADDAAFNAEGNAARDRAKVIDFKPACHRGTSQRAHGFAHGFIEQRGNDSAMQIAGMSIEFIRYNGKADNSAIGRLQKFKTQSREIGRATAEAAIVCRVRKRRQVLLVRGHACLAG